MIAFFLLLLICGLAVQMAAGSDPPLLIHHLKQRFAKSSDSQPIATSKDRGYVTCASKKHIHDLLRTIYFLRTEWKSQYPISIMHCHELDQNDLDLITAMDEFGNITPMDICAPRSSLLSIVSATRLRGFMCKVGALLESPYDMTVLIDVDVVWLRPPDLLFESQLVAETGALFFRDRILHTPSVTKQDPKDGSRSSDFVKLLQTMGITLNASYVQAQFYANGVSPWWRCLADYWPEDARAVNCYGEAQDSSMVIVDKRRHPGMMAMLRRLLPSFDVGYGDKEIYWLAATLANEPFTFSPFAAAQYGDCSGQVLHYLPDDVLLFRDQRNVTAAQLRRLRPFYINAEYMVEHNGKLNAVGNFFQSRYVAAQLFHDPRTMQNRTTDLFPHNHCYSKPHFASNCTCAAYDCMPMQPWILHQLAYHQWVTLSLRLDRSMSLAQYYSTHEQTPHCVPVLVLAMGALNGVFHHHASTLLYQRYLSHDGGGRSHGLSGNNAKHLFTNFNKTANTFNSVYTASASTSTAADHQQPHGKGAAARTGFDPRNCGVIGCSVLPLHIYDPRWQSEDAWAPGFGRFCEPIRFANPTATSAGASNSHHHSHTTKGSQHHQFGGWNHFPVHGLNLTGYTMDTSNVVPIDFVEAPIAGYDNQSLLVLAKRFRQPLDKINQPAFKTPQQLIQCGHLRSLYQLSTVDHVFHQFPNFATFVKMGFDTSDVMRLRLDECELVKFGNQLPDIST